MKLAISLLLPLAAALLLVWALSVALPAFMTGGR